MNLIDIPKIAPAKIQKAAPGPPNEIERATPAILPVPIVPEQAKGRGIALINKKAVEVQFAVPFDVESEASRTTAIQGVYKEMSSSTASQAKSSAAAPISSLLCSSSSPSPLVLR